ncbi:MAG: Uma2 family endonuclease [Panacagrimonas sp.]
MTALRKHPDAQSFDDYLAWEEIQTERHEYVNGLAYAMTGGRQAHHVIVNNVTVALNRLFGEHCLIFSQGYKLRIRRVADERSYYPDAFVTCQPGDADALFNEQPCLIVEVLSDSTRRIDLGEKREAYTRIPGALVYLAIDSRRAEARLYRASSGWAEEIVAGLDVSVPLRCSPDGPDANLELREVYRRVFPQG